MTMLLEIENKTPQQVEEFSKVENILGELRSYGPSSFAILTDDGGSYVQVAGGKVTCVLEYRNLNEKKHFRAYLKKAKVPHEGTLTLMFGGGHMTMEPNEVLFIEDVILVFKAFFNHKPFPEEILWRDISNMFEGLGA